MGKVVPTITFLHKRFHSSNKLKDADRIFALMVTEARRLASTSNETEINLANKLINNILG